MVWQSSTAVVIAANVDHPPQPRDRGRAAIWQGRPQVDNLQSIDIIVAVTQISLVQFLI